MIVLLRWSMIKPVLYVVLPGHRMVMLLLVEVKIASFLSGRYRQGRDSSLIVGTVLLSVLWPGRPMVSLLLLAALTKLCRSGVLPIGSSRLYSRIEATLILSGVWRGLLMECALLQPARTGRF